MKRRVDGKKKKKVSVIAMKGEEIDRDSLQKRATDQKR